MMFDALGYPEQHPLRAIARRSIEKLLAVHAHEAYCQPCVSPIWDTGLVCHALLEVGGDRAVAQARKGLEWLVPQQILDVEGDWIARRPDLRPGGWAFQYANPHYPDVDDTAVVVMAMDRAQGLERQQRLPRIDRSRARMDLGNAERERRLGRVRCRQRILLSQQHPVRRPWRFARSSDRGRDRALRFDAGAARRDRGQQRGGGARGRLSAPHAAGGGQLVRPLGHELHLRHLVGAVRAQRRRRRSRRPANSARRSPGSSASRIPTAAGARTARATSSTTAATSAHRARRRRPPGRCSA